MDTHFLIKIKTKATIEVNGQRNENEEQKKQQQPHHLRASLLFSEHN